MSTPPPILPPAQLTPVQLEVLDDVTPDPGPEWVDHTAADAELDG